MGTRRRKTRTGRVYMGNAEAAEEMDDLDTEGPVAVMWDIENCPIPAGVPPMDVSGNVRNSLMVHGGVKGAITTFSAYGDYSHLSKEIRQGCQKTGINLIDVPSGNKDAADKAILIDMFLFALDNRPPALILLISGDVDFAPALHKLRQRGYTIAVALPRVKVHSALSNAGKFVWDWHNMASNKGLGTISRFNVDIMAENVPKSSLNEGECQGHQPEPTNANGEKIPRSDLMPSLKKQKGENHLFSTRGLHQEWQGTTRWNAHSHKYQRKMQCIEYVFRSFDNPIQGTMSATVFRSFDNPMPSLKKQEDVDKQGLCSEEKGVNSKSSRQTEDINALKENILRVVSMNGGKLRLGDVASCYERAFKKKICLVKYGYHKLYSIIQEIGDLCIEGDGGKRSVYIKVADNLDISIDTNGNKRRRTNS